MRHWRNGLTATAVMLLALTVGACSSSGGSSGTSGSATTNGGGSPSTHSSSVAGSANAGGSGASSSASASGTVLHVGVVCACSGPFGASESNAWKVADAWAKSVNASGGVDGHPVQLTLKDDGSNPGTSVTSAQGLISSKVPVILSITTLESAWAQNAAKAKVPVVGGAFTSPTYYTNPDFYPSGQTNDSIVMANVEVAKAAGATNLGHLYCAEAPQCQEDVAPQKAAAAKLGLPDVYTASISATAPNYTAQCLAAKQAGVTALLIEHSSSVVAHVTSDCATQGYNPIFIEEGTGFTTQVAAANGAKDHLWASFPTEPFFASTPAVQEMVKAVNKYYPGILGSDSFSGSAVQAWTGMLLIAKALSASGVAANQEITAADITKGLNSMKGETLGGFSPPLTFTAGQPHKVDCWFTGRVQNGKPRLLNGGKPTCQKS